MHEAVHAGDLLGISEPKCHFALVEAATESALLAGGIGITPIFAMAEHLAARQQAFSLAYCARSAGSAAFLDRIAGASWSDRARTYFDDQGGAELGAVLGAPHPGKHLYICGPTGFLDAALETARRLGWREDCLHREYFSNEVATTGGAFDVQIASSGRVIRIQPQQTIAAALEAEGIVVPTSCEQGVCGTCITRVLGGTPDHRDLFMTEEEHAANDCLTVCCSRSVSSLLVLDL